MDTIEHMEGMEKFTLKKGQFLLKNQPTAAKAYAEAWIKECPNALEALQFSGFLYAQEKNWEQALFLFKKALKLASSEVSNHINISNIYVSLGNFQTAITHLREALRLDPFHAEAYNNLGRLFYKEGRVPDAIPYFEKALRIDPNYTEAHYNLAHAFSKQNQFLKAINHYQEVLRLSPEHPTTHLNLGILYHAEGQFLEAIPHLTKATIYDEKNCDALKLLGDAYLNAGKTNEAIETFEKALVLIPKLSIAHHNLAILYLRKSDNEKALLHFTKALNLDPANETAKHMINALTGNTMETSAPPEYIAQLFDQYANYYNLHLRQKLDYQAHVLLRNAVGKCLQSNPKTGRVLDLGCGTGLCGVVFRDLARELIGVDLSSNMIAEAKTLDTYEKLIVADIHPYLAQTNLEPFDLIIAGDVLVYSGDLNSLFSNVAKNLNANGFFAFTIESLPEGTSQPPKETFQLQPSGRFAHASAYIHQLAKANHLKIVQEEAVIIRKQEGNPIGGRLYVLATQRL